MCPVANLLAGRMSINVALSLFTSNPNAWGAIFLPLRLFSILKNMMARTKSSPNKKRVIAHKLKPTLHDCSKISKADIIPVICHKCTYFGLFYHTCPLLGFCDQLIKALHTPRQHRPVRHRLPERTAFGVGSMATISKLARPMQVI